MDSVSTYLEKLNKAQATSARSLKMEVVRTFTEFDRMLTRWALDPTVSFYVTKLEIPTSVGTSDIEPQDLELLDDLSSRRITGNAALERIALHLERLNPAAREVLRRVLLKDLRCGVGASTVNAVFPGDIPEYPYMRCSLPAKSHMNKWDWSQGVFAQLKCDGSFARVAVKSGGVSITTRQGNTYPAGALATLERECLRTFSDNTETHGELTVWRDGECLPRQVGNGMLNSLQQGGEFPSDCAICFDCWDQIPLNRAVPGGSYNVPYIERHFELSKQVMEKQPELIQMVESYCVASMDEAMTRYRSFIARGLEGAVLKYAQGIWKDHTSPNCVKLKVEVALDLEIVGFNPGEQGKRTELTFGSVKCKSHDGLLEVDVAGFNREMEAYLHEHRDSVLGKIMCVKANALAEPSPSNEKYSLFHPRFLELRQDKVEADTLEQVKAQFESVV